MNTPATYQSCRFDRSGGFLMVHPIYLRMLNTSGVDTLMVLLPSNPSIPFASLTDTFGNTFRIILAAPLTSA